MIGDVAVQALGVFAQAEDDTKLVLRILVASTLSKIVGTLEQAPTVINAKTAYSVYNNFNALDLVSLLNPLPRRSILWTWMAKPVKMKMKSC